MLLIDSFCEYAALQHNIKPHNTGYKVGSAFLTNLEAPIWIFCCCCYITCNSFTFTDHTVNLGPDIPALKTVQKKGVNKATTNVTQIHTHTDQCLSLLLFPPGRYRPGKDKPDPKTWKANFRCALNSLPDICELQEHSRKRGSNAYRVYRMMPSTQTHRRRKGKTRTHIYPFKDKHVVTDWQRDLMWQHHPVLTQGCGCLAGLQTDRPVLVGMHIQRTCGNPPQDPRTTHHSRWRPLQKTHFATLKHTVRCLLLRFFCCSDSCICFLPRMIGIVVVQGHGRPNQRTRNKVRLCLRYQSCQVPTNRLTKCNGIWFFCFFSGLWFSWLLSHWLTGNEKEKPLDKIVLFNSKNKGRQSLEIKLAVAQHSQRADHTKKHH